MPEQRTGVATFGGKPITLIGPELKPGDKAPNFKLVDKDLKIVRLTSLGHKVKLISVATSLDTGICDEQTRKFNSELSQFGDKVALVSYAKDIFAIVVESKEIADSFRVFYEMAWLAGKE